MAGAAGASARATASRLRGVAVLVALPALVTTGCGLLVGVDWDRAVAQDGGAPWGYLPDGAVAPPGYEGGIFPDGSSGSCAAPNVPCLDGCCPSNADVGVAIQISANGSNTCAVTTTGQIRCWGANGNGQLGLGDGPPFVGTSSKPLTVTRIPRGATKVAVGNTHACALVNGALACWGSNETGELGNASSTPSAVPVKSAISGTVGAFSAGENATCAVINGAGACWGSNRGYVLGEEVDTSVETARVITQLPTGVTDIAISGQHTCAVMNGAVLCWGSNSSLMLGSNGPTLTGTPTASALTAGASQLALGYTFTCALAGDAARCWGDNIFGELGIDAQSATATPVEPRGLGSGVTSLCTGELHTCAVVAGAVMCFGSNAKGQLGLGDPQSIPTRSLPTAVPGLSGATQVACGLMHTCALMQTGAIKCWGLNDNGQLGNSRADSANSPSDVTW